MPNGKPTKQSSEGVKKSKMKEVINLWLSNNLHNTIEIHENFEVHLHDRWSYVQKGSKIFVTTFQIYIS